MALVDLPSPMNATVFKVLVRPGDAVRERQEVIVLEAMKMEIPVEAPSAGTVAEVCVAPSQRVSEGEVLLRLET